MTWYATARGRLAVALAIGALVVLEGLVSVRIGFPSFESRIALLAWLTGSAVLACGLAAWLRAPVSRVGPLLVLTAAAWFVGGFRWVAWDPLSELASATDLVYAAVVSQAVLTFPSGRTNRRIVRALIVAVYIASVVPVPRADLLVAIALMGGILAVTLTGPRGRRERHIVSAWGGLFAVVLGSAQIAYGSIDAIGWLDVRPLLQGSLVVLAIALALPLVRSVTRPLQVSDVVVELGASPRYDLVAELGRLVGDSNLRIGFWFATRGAYVDAVGRPVALPGPGSESAATTIERGGEPLAVVVHDADTTVEAGVVDAIGRALELAAANARLQAESRDRIADARASRQRLVLAADDERRVLEARLTAGLEPGFTALEARLSELEVGGEEDVVTPRVQLREARDDLRRLVEGMVPPVLGERGMAAALAELAADPPVPVELRVEDGDVPTRTAQAALFVTSEALANIAKHAAPTRASISLTRDDSALSIEVADDGRGGADPAKGSGLRGLIDRVEAMGGRLVIDSREGSGTRVWARLPLEDPGW